MTIQVLNPTSEQSSRQQSLAARINTLSGASVGIISNGKEGTQPFFDHLERVLRDRYGVASVIQRVKGNYSAPAEVELMQEVQHWDAVVTGIGD